jgi:hypothetical protein
MSVVSGLGEGCVRGAVGADFELVESGAGRFEGTVRFRYPCVFMV